MKNRLPHLYLTLLAALLLTACGGSPSEPAKPSTFSIGVLIQNPSVVAVWDGFKARMTELGYEDGKNITYMYQGPTETADKVEALVRSFQEAKVTLLLVLGTTTMEMVQKVIGDSDQLMLFYVVVDPVKAGFVKSLKEPGSNRTGVTINETLYALRLEWLLKITPNVKRLYIPYNPNVTAAGLAVKYVKEVAPKFGLEIMERPAKNREEMTAVMQSIPDDIDAIYLPPGAATTIPIEDYVAASLNRKLPMTVYQDIHVPAGGLMSYGTYDKAIGAQLARMADRVIKGAKPGELPMEIAEYFLSVNLKTAQAIGLTIPDDILRQASTIVR